MASGGKNTAGTEVNRLTCSVCLEPFRQPRLLPCFHTFCTPCLQELADSVVTGATDKESTCKGKEQDSSGTDQNSETVDTKSSSFLCPTCRKPVTVPPGGVKEFQSNFYLEADMSDQKPSAPACDMCDEDNTAAYVCNECQQNLCQTCRGFHDRVAVTKSHQVTSLAKGRGKQTGITKSAPASREDFCRAHGDQKLLFYCHQCQAAICLYCKLTSHEGHTTEDMAVAAERIRAEVHKLSLDLKMKMEVADRVIVQVTKELQELQQQRQTVMEEAQASAEKIMAWVKQAQDKLSDQVEEIADPINKKLQDQLEQAVGTKTTLTDLQDRTKAVLERGTHADLVVLKAEIEECTMTRADFVYEPGKDGEEITLFSRFEADGNIVVSSDIHQHGGVVSLACLSPQVILMSNNKGSCSARKKRRSNGDFQVPFLQGMDDILGHDLGRMVDGLDSGQFDGSNTLGDFHQVLTWSSNQPGTKGHKTTHGTRHEGHQNIKFQQIGYQAFIPPVQSYKIDDDLNKIQQQLDEILNLDASNLIEGINKLLADQQQNPQNEPSAKADKDCLFGGQYMTEIYQLFESFGQTQGMLEFLQTTQQLFRRLQNTNPSLAEALQKVFLTGDGSLRKVVEDFVNGRPVSAVENVLKAVASLSDVVDINTLDTVLTEVKSVTTDLSIQQALESLQLVVNSLSNDQDVTQAFQEILGLLQGVIRDGKAKQSLTVLAGMLPKFFSDPLLIQVMEQFPSNPSAYQVFEIMRLLTTNTNATSADVVRIVQSLESMMTALVDNGKFLQVISRFTQSQSVNDALNVIGQLFASFVTSNPEMDRAIQALNETIMGFSSHWDILQTFVRLSVNQDAMEAFKTVMLLFQNVTALSPEQNQAVLYTIDSLRDFLIKSQLVQAIHTFSVNPKARKAFEAAVRMYGNSTATGMTKLVAVEELLVFFANNSPILETIRNATVSPDAKQVFEIMMKLLQSRDTASPDMSSLILTMGNVMNDLAQNTELAEAFVRFSNNPDTGKAVIFIMKLLRNDTSVDPGVVRVVSAAEQALNVFTSNPALVQTIASLTNSPTLVGSVDVLVNWLTPVNSTADPVPVLLVMQAAVFSNQRLVIALQNYAVNAELTQAFDVFKILVESLNTTDPLIQQAVLVVQTTLHSLHNNRDAYETLEVVLKNPLLLRAMTDIANGSSVERVFLLMVDNSDFRHVLLQITNESRLVQAVSIFHDIIVAIPDTPYASEAFLVAVRVFKGFSNYTEVQLVAQDIRQLIQDIDGEGVSSPSFEKLQLALMELLQVLNATLAIAESSTTVTPSLSTLAPTSAMLVTSTPTESISVISTVLLVTSESLRVTPTSATNPSDAFTPSFAVSSSSLQTSYRPAVSATRSGAINTASITPTWSTVPAESTKPLVTPVVTVPTTVSTRLSHTTILSVSPTEVPPTKTTAAGGSNITPTRTATPVSSPTSGSTGMSYVSTLSGSPTEAPATYFPTKSTAVSGTINPTRTATIEASPSIGKQPRTTEITTPGTTGSGQPARSSFVIEPTTTQAVQATVGVSVAYPPPVTTRRPGGGGTSSSAARPRRVSLIALVVIWVCQALV
ncbi:hypothetical protein BaRGS_00001106 [Batillaria attramentaria]|uniref:Uncharacterized protein n=1 Tax=Batillaria attramentaria TaxID=370345 RepID=A0ABD0M6W7_9CAEN